MQTCLVIDEYSVVRKIASRILTLAGYTVHCAETPAEAISLMDSSGPIDLALVSATLPDCPVDEAIRIVRSHRQAGEAVVLASLVESHLGLMTRAKRAGAKGFVYRPFDRASLTAWLAPYAGPQAAQADA